MCSISEIRESKDHQTQPLRISLTPAMEGDDASSEST